MKGEIKDKKKTNIIIQDGLTMPVLASLICEAKRYPQYITFKVA